MKYTERKKKLEYLLEMIQKGRCISLAHIAYVFNVSRRTAKRMLVELREEGHHIVYFKSLGRFFLDLDKKNNHEDKICPPDL